LAVLAMEAIASWSNVESFKLRLFIQLVGGLKATVAASIFLALQSNLAKSQAIQAAAATVLKERQDELQLLSVILRLAKTREKDRDKLAHWVWGDSPDVHTGILVIDPKDLVVLEFSRVYVYTTKDFNSIIEGNERLWV
jgi:hypothetical protein